VTGAIQAQLNAKAVAADVLNDTMTLKGLVDVKVSSALPSAGIFVGNASNIAAGVAMSGDVTIDNTGATAIGSAKVTSSMLAGAVDARR